MQILLVEQEVVGDEKTVLQTVLETDVLREKLLAEEAKLEKENTDKAATRILEIYTELEEIGAYTAEIRVKNHFLFKL